MNALSIFFFSSDCELFAVRNVASSGILCKANFLKRFYGIAGRPKLYSRCARFVCEFSPLEECKIFYFIT